MQITRKGKDEAIAFEVAFNLDVSDYCFELSRLDGHGQTDPDSVKSMIVLNRKRD